MAILSIQSVDPSLITIPEDSTNKYIILSDIQEVPYLDINNNKLENDNQGFSTTVQSVLVDALTNLGINFNGSNTTNPPTETSPTFSNDFFTL